MRRRQRFGEINRQSMPSFALASFGSELKSNGPIGVLDRELDRLSVPTGFSSDSVDCSFFDDNDAVTILRDSTSLGWHGAYAALTLERPHETIRRPIPAVWIATGLGKTSLRRFLRGRENYDPDIPGRAITITPPGENARDVIGIAAKALHVFLFSTVIDEVASELLDRQVEDVSVAPAFCVDDPVMAPLLRIIQKSLWDPPSEARLRVDHLTRVLAAHVLGAGSQLRPASRSWQDLPARQMRMLQDYIRSNLASDISIGDLANLLGLSRTQFLRRFKASTGTSPYQRVMEARVERAKELLADPHMSLPDIAASCGFASQSHLTTVFQRFVKLSPSAFRRHI